MTFWPPGVAAGHKVLELFVGAQAAVHPAVIDGIVAVGAALEQRADIDGRAAKALPRAAAHASSFANAPGVGLAVVFVRTAAQPQRIDVIKYLRSSYQAIDRTAPIHIIKSAPPCSGSTVYHKIWQICE